MHLSEGGQHMVRRTGNMKLEVVEGIRISITAPMEDRTKQRELILKKAKKYGGEIVDEENAFQTTTLMIKFSNYKQKDAWLSSMQFYNV